MKEKLCGIGMSLLIIVCCLIAAGPSKKVLPKQESDPVNSQPLPQAVLDEINAARAAPPQYAAYLEEYRKGFQGLRTRTPDGATLITNEGAAAVDEVIVFLKAQSPLAPLKFADGLNSAAALQLRDVIANPSLGHTGADGSSFDQRIKRFGATRGQLGENISFGSDTAREIVISWIVDDGVPSRLHRLNLFNPAFKSVGIAFGTGNNNRGVCVLVMTDGFGEKGEIKAIELFD